MQKKAPILKIKIKANALQTKKSLVVLGSMVERNIKNQYRKSVLGILWTVLNPLLNMLVLSFVFSSIFGREVIGLDYPVYVLSGNIVFSIMRTATSESMTCMVDNYDLLTKTRVPYSVFPISKVLSAAVNFGFALIALVIVMLVRIPAGVRFHWTMFMIPVWLPSIMMFSLGLSFILSAIYVRFRDIKHIYNVFLTLWMYTTPIFYSISSLNSQTVQSVLVYNPMLHYVNYFRELLMGAIPSWQSHLICFGVGLATLGIGWLIFKLSKNKFILYI
jgi:ABC-2 type transport system permease protein